jgi:hypothetical protein
MKVKIGNKIYHSNDEPIMIILNDKEKRLIKNMNKKHKRFCVFPSDNDIEKIEEFMKI